VNYFGLPEIRGLSAKTAAGFVSFYWGGSMIGRFLGAGVLRRVKAGDALAFCAIAAATLVTVSMLVGGAIVGGAVVPLMVGAMADHFGLHHAFVIPVICYLYILYYGLRGSKPNSERNAIA
jgi:FHS family L-fucose permease-like MFS transporter